VNVRFYGDPPYRAAIVHGGPGAPGAMAPVARSLSNSGISVIEPLQTKTTIQGQIDELAETICPYSPITLIGHSWGAWLSYLTAARYPNLVEKLILVSSGPFEFHYAESIMPTRLSRLTPDQRVQAQAYLTSMNEGTLTDEAFAAFGAMMDEADTYCPIEEKDEIDPVPCDAKAFAGVWTEADAMRRSGELLSRASQIQCPALAIHGDYDSHPYKGVEEPLSRVLDDFRFILLKRCGHTPWEERYARDTFFAILQDEMK
jgi:pimeloyl-ACP methyl ester carboxylesterase